jgi:SAM-dependent methyltransferase
VIDLGCGPGLPIAEVLVAEGLNVFGLEIADILVPGGRLLFTSPAEPVVWNDAMTGLESRSLGAEEYQRQLSAVGLRVLREYEDEGQNHYFEALK